MSLLSDVRKIVKKSGMSVNIQNASREQVNSVHEAVDGVMIGEIAMIVESSHSEYHLIAVVGHRIEKVLSSDSLSDVVRESLVVIIDYRLQD